MKLKIKKNDTVIVLSGNNKGMTGRVLNVDSDKMRVLVEQVNVRVKHEKSTQQNSQKGGIIHKEMPIHYSKIALVEDKKPVRVGIKIDDKGNKIRYSHASGKVI
jgi:large subunit ribosomal protein L24